MQASPTSPGFGALAEFSTSEDSLSILANSASASVRSTLSASASLPHLSSVLHSQQLQGTWLAQASCNTGPIASSSVALSSQQQSQRPFPWSSNSDVSGYVQPPRTMHRSVSATELAHAAERSVRGGIPSYQRASVSQAWDRRALSRDPSMELASLTEVDTVRMIIECRSQVARGGNLVTSIIKHLSLD